MPAAGKKTVEDIAVQNCRVLVRGDFNVPMSPGSARISDDSRIRAALPTISYLRDRGCRVMLCSHLGRPGGEVDEEMRLAPVRERLSELLGIEVVDGRGPAGTVPMKVMESLAPGAVALLENLRFNKREETNDPGFARKLSALGEVFVNDAFGVAHRAHASTVGIAEHLPAVAGLLMARELEMLAACLENPRRPVLAIIGGAKVSDKIAVLTHLAGRVDTVLIGGGMVTAFLAANGHVDTGAVASADVEAARSLPAVSQARIITPTEVVTAAGFAWTSGPDGGARVAEQGCCRAFGDWLAAGNAVAAPLVSRAGGHLYGINAGGPSFSVAREVLMNELGPRLARIARDLSGPSLTHRSSGGK